MLAVRDGEGRCAYATTKAAVTVFYFLPYWRMKSSTIWRAMSSLN